MYIQIICLVLTVSATNAANILGVFMTPSYSHQVVYQPVWKELSLKGHKVTVITTNPLKDPSLTNLTEIDLSYSYEIWKNHNIPILGTKEHSTAQEIKKISEAYMSLSHYQLSQPEVQSLIKRENNETFDLLLVEFLYPVMYAFKDVYKCPMVGLTSLGLTGSGYAALGNPKHPILDPEFALPFSTDLTFKERIISTVFHYMFRLGTKVQLMPKLNKLIKQYFGDGIRSAAELIKEASVVIVNSNYALQAIRPTVPAFVEISGMHLQPRKPLPNDLQVFLDKAKNGVIYFSLGSNVKSNLLPKEKLEQLMGAFSQLPYQVLWKFEDEELLNKPANVEIRKWIPQQDILAHPNIKLFITQGGLQSLDEALHNGVPMIGMPFFGDQRFNCDRMVKLGAAEMINFHDFSSAELTGKINKIISNPTYKETAVRLGAIAADQPTPPLEKAVWWIEYVLRHNGAKHLRYGSLDMPLYQYYMLDVYIFFIVLLGTVIYILRRIVPRIILGYHFMLRTLSQIKQFLWRVNISREHQHIE